MEVVSDDNINVNNKEGQMIDLTDTDNTQGSKKIFIRGANEKYTLLEKEELDDLCVHKKRKYDELASSQKGLGAQDGYISVAVRGLPRFSEDEIF